MEAYYFGCWRSSGHYHYLPGGMRPPIRSIKNERELTPWGFAVDGELTPRGKHRGTEGAAKVTHKDGWTALSFADYSVDIRGGSHSTFLLHATLSYKEALESSRRIFPEVFARFDFAVFQAD